MSFPNPVRGRHTRLATLALLPGPVDFARTWWVQAYGAVAPLKSSPVELALALGFLVAAAAAGLRRR